MYILDIDVSDKVPASKIEREQTVTIEDAIESIGLAQSESESVSMFSILGFYHIIYIMYS